MRDMNNNSNGNETMTGYSNDELKNIISNTTTHIAATLKSAQLWAQSPVGNVHRNLLFKISDLETRQRAAAVELQSR